ncbi:hypothetical protein EXIGLDRAFT_364526 [Exidia glandulosa HHB12029]|uniref:Uncharacterized protein n=1 Tax=Exidia glandulosa HHB12029 TaxID=1314781 RepID=A0A165C470_EXIGL|nr:hypothetical protein EXIGLDRAFT_364526 [Exidia glandulosa HHB12029]
MPSFKDLPLDVLCLSLFFVADFETMLAAILTFKAWALAYHVNNKTIIRAVLINIMTPDVAAAALFHIRIGAQMCRDPRPSQAAFIQFVRFGIDETNMLDQYITGAEFWELLDCARISDKLEEIWTRRCVCRFLLPFSPTSDSFFASQDVQEQHSASYRCLVSFAAQRLQACRAADVVAESVRAPRQPRSRHLRGPRSARQPVL